MASLCEDRRGGLCEWAVGLAGDHEPLARFFAWLTGWPLGVLVVALATVVGVRLLRRWIRLAVYRVVVGASGGGTDGGDDGTEDSAGVGGLARAKARASSITVVLAGAAAIAVWAVSVITMLGLVGVDIAPMIAGAGIAGIAVGFGAQNLIRDVVAGLFILIEDQFGLGDVVEIDGVSGTVEALSLRATQLRSANGTVWFVPNGQITQLGNMTKTWSAAVLDVDVAYEADIDQVRSVLEETARALAGDPDYSPVMVEPPQVLGVESLGANGITIRVLMKVAAGQQWTIQRLLRERVKAALEDAQIEIPFPQRTVWLRTQEA